VGTRCFSSSSQLGTASLFIYWIHVELVYGAISRPLRQALSLPPTAIADVLFTGFMLHDPQG
jgi:hypothetical protein